MNLIAQGGLHKATFLVGVTGFEPAISSSPKLGAGAACNPIHAGRIRMKPNALESAVVAVLFAAVLTFRSVGPREVSLAVRRGLFHGGRARPGP
jgi:hypothetical protein